MSFDPKCYELAESFLSDVPPEAVGKNSVNELAQAIQDTIEMYIGMELGIMPDRSGDATDPRRT